MKLLFVYISFSLSFFYDRYKTNEILQTWKVELRFERWCGLKQLHKENYVRGSEMFHVEVKLGCWKTLY